MSNAEEDGCDRGSDQHKKRENFSVFQYVSCHGDGHVDHNGCNSGLHSFQQQGDHRIAAELDIENGDDGEDDHRRQDGACHCQKGACYSGDVVSDDDRSVDCHHAGTGLGDGHQVHDFVLADPVEFLYKFFWSIEMITMPPPKVQALMIKQVLKRVQESGFI